VATCSERLGEDQPQTARARATLGGALLDQHKTTEGRAELERAIAVLDKTLGPTHPDTSAARADLAKADAPAR
jgi:hypothetical protein